MRKYEAAWIQLKTQGTVRIAAHRSLHKRIIKAVIKEKDIDLAFKLFCAEKYVKTEICYSQNTSVITFNLKKFSTIIYGPSAKKFDIQNI